MVRRFQGMVPHRRRRAHHLFTVTDAPFTVTDAATRYLIRCVAVEKTDTARVRAVMEAAFLEHGMPLGIRTAGLSRLALWWIRLGIRHERIEPGEPQQNGRHERFHLTLQQETAEPLAASRAAQQRLFQSFQEIYNRQRPHQALHYETPQDRYQPSRLPEPEFPAGAMLRRVAVHGDLKWRGERVFVSEVLAHEPVGLRRLTTARFCWAGWTTANSVSFRRTGPRLTYNPNRADPRRADAALFPGQKVSTRSPV